MAGPQDDAETGRVGFRDIYRAVGESEARILAALNASFAPLSAASSDHEVRIRSIESHGSPEAREALLRVAALEAQVSPLAILSAERDRRLSNVEMLASGIAETQRAGINRASGVSGTFSTTQKVIVTAAAMGGIITLLIQLLVR